MEEFIKKDELFGLEIEETDGGVLIRARCPKCLNFVELKLSKVEMVAGDMKSSICKSGEHAEVFQLNARFKNTEIEDVDGNTDVWGKFPG